MSARSNDEALSAAMDGEAGAHELDALCAAWPGGSAMRAQWHAYHLIGDVLRSEDLAASPEHDEAFLHRLRGRLAVEPVVLAPSPRSVDAPPRRRAAGAAFARRRWTAPLATAAGFMAVAGVVVVTRVSAPDAGPGPQLASTTAGAQQVAMPPAAAEAALVADGKLIRDARLDRYLAAHKQFGGSAALAVPGMALRSATAAPPER